jgi:hypothetical protein
VKIQSRGACTFARFERSFSAAALAAAGSVNRRLRETIAWSTVCWRKPLFVSTERSPGSGFSVQPEISRTGAQAIRLEVERRAQEQSNKRMQLAGASLLMNEGLRASGERRS